MSKGTWKKYYRLMRIARREAIEATMDTLVYGTGLVRINSAGVAKRIKQAYYEGVSNA